jgi:hypothetical protein
VKQPVGIATAFGVLGRKLSANCGNYGVLLLTGKEKIML